MKKYYKVSILTSRIEVFNYITVKIYAKYKKMNNQLKVRQVKIFEKKIHNTRVILDSPELNICIQIVVPNFHERGNRSDIVVIDPAIFVEYNIDEVYQQIVSRMLWGCNNFGKYIRRIYTLYEDGHYNDLSYYRGLRIQVGAYDDSM